MGTGEMRRGFETRKLEKLKCVDRVILTRTANDFGGFRARAKAKRENVSARKAILLEEKKTAREAPYSSETWSKKTERTSPSH